MSQVLEAADQIGGGTRTQRADRARPAARPLLGVPSRWRVGSPYLSTLGLERHGLRWRWPEIDCAHPLDDGRGRRAVAIDRRDRGRPRRRRQALAAAVRQRGRRASTTLADDLMRPHRARAPPPAPPGSASGRPRCCPADADRPGVAHRQGQGAVGGRRRPRVPPAAPPDHLGDRDDASSPPATATAGRSPRAAPSRSPTRWPRCSTTSAARSTPASTSASAADIPPRRCRPARPRAGADRRILGDRLPARVARAYRRYRHGPGAFKVDFAIEGDVPWTNEHAAAPAPSTSAAPSRRSPPPSAPIARGARCPSGRSCWSASSTWPTRRRSAGNVNPLWTYAHVPARLHRRRHRGDHRPDRTVRPRLPRPHRRHVRALDDRRCPSYNPNYVGGDIIAGANTERQVLFRPRARPRPVRTGIPGMFICSAATPPGAGAHGMCGYNAAGSALRHLRIPPVTAS